MSPRDLRLLGRAIVEKVVQPGHDAFEVVGAVGQYPGVDQGLPKPVQGQGLGVAVEEFVADRIARGGDLPQERAGRLAGT